MAATLQLFNASIYLCKAHLTHEVRDDPVKPAASVSKAMLSCAQGSEVFCSQLNELKETETFCMFVFVLKSYLLSLAQHPRSAARENRNMS